VTEVGSSPEPDPETMAAIIGAVETFLAEERKTASKPARGTLNPWKMAGRRPLRKSSRLQQSWKTADQDIR